MHKFLTAVFKGVLSLVVIIGGITIFYSLIVGDFQGAANLLLVVIIAVLLMKKFDFLEKNQIPRLW
jgi:hypothetical protein